MSAFCRYPNQMSAFSASAPGRLPRLPALHLDRPRLLERIRREARVWAICGPAGFGKTTLAAQGVLGSAGSWRYLRLGQGDDAAAVFGQVIGASEIPGLASSLENALDAVEQAGITNLIIDDADAAAASGRAAIRSLCALMDRAISVTVCVRSIESVIEPRWLCDGSAEAIDWNELAFDVHDLEALCTLTSVPFDAREGAQLLEQTLGWPMVVSGALHCASRREAPLGDALRVWEEERLAAFRDFAIAECSRSHNGSKFIGAIENRCVITSDDLHGWEREGLFVVRRDGVPELLPPARRALELTAKSSRAAALEPMVAKLLGELRVSIGGVALKWVRRKDAQVFKYLLLKENGTATRREIMEVFWPGREAGVAAQNLRTTCSNIRRAMRSVVGEVGTDAYFRSEDDISVVLQNVMTDVAEFQGHVNAARAGYSQGAHRSVHFHLERARELYRGDLLAGMPHCGQEELGAQLRRSLGEVLHLLRTLSFERGPVVSNREDMFEESASA